MFCNKCGTEIPSNSIYCPNCGQKCDMHSEIKLIKLQCKNCNGIMSIDSNAQEITCPYCGVKEKILDSEAVAIEKIKSNTYKELEFAKMANENERIAHQEKNVEQNLYRKSKLCKATIFFIFICMLTMLTSFKSNHILAGLISLVQIGLFCTSWLIGIQIITVKQRFIYIALAILGFLMIIPFYICINGENYEKLVWPQSGIVTNIPDPQAKYGNIITNDENSFYASINKYSEAEYEDYIKSCKNMGYIIDNEISISSYTAYNDTGYKISLSLYSDTLHINLAAPKKMEKFSWPTSYLGKLLPKPISTIGKIEWESNDGFVIYVGNTSLTDFKTYIQKVSDAGFIVDYEKGDTYYYADNSDGYQVDIRYEGNQIMFIRIDEPDDDIENKEE